MRVRVRAVEFDGVEFLGEVRRDWLEQVKV